MEGLESGRDRMSLKRPFETFEHDLHPLPVTGALQQQWDFNLSWGQSFLDNSDISSGLNHNSLQENDFTFSQAPNSHVTTANVTLPFMLNPIVELEQEHNPIRTETPSEICLGSVKNSFRSYGDCADICEDYRRESSAEKHELSPGRVFFRSGHCFVPALSSCSRRKLLFFRTIWKQVCCFEQENV